ncbi:UNVERIFIED_ORG: hypothetical protein J3D58_002255 [Paenarthrobacter nicotinovorans]
MTDRVEVTMLDDRNEVLRRQVVDAWTADGIPMSVAFIPTPKDARKLSTDRERASAQDSFERYERTTGTAPNATWGISVGEILDANQVLDEERREAGKLCVIDDANKDGNHEDHASVCFPDMPISKNQERKSYERMGKDLKRVAIERGKLHTR